MNRFSRLILIGVFALCGFSQNRCLLLDQPFSERNLPLLAQLLPGLLSQSTFAFLNDSAGDNQARTLFKIPSTGIPERIDWSGGPAQIRDAAIVNGVIFAADTSSTDDFWISRDQGMNWESVDLPSGNESTSISYVVGCGTSVIVTQGSIAYNGTGTQPGYISRDSGASWQEVRVGIGPSSTGTGNIVIRGIDCTDSRIYVASSESSNRIQYASLDNLSAWTGVPNTGVSYSDYTDLTATTAGFAGLAQDDFNTIQCALNYSSDGGASVDESGIMPNMNFGCNGALRARYAIPDTVVVSEPDSSTETCRIYVMSNLAISPASVTPANRDCSDVGNLGIMPGILYANSGIYVSYASAPSTSTGLLRSMDNGQNFSKLDLSSIWSDSGYIIDLESYP
ncbi:MAG TPA: hypothetical protein DEA96_04255 [Leptospiraceae bacterium]|nr:hypothetical protein [Spirochaetaceae bacterium]HBS04154.1 hypothetical protein [Leptospiraceae bacterium]|tara:strand:+ start:65460 stop:66644 length:1185 start_codon:yes stop_codon:yes gene_type:complete